MQHNGRAAVLQALKCGFFHLLATTPNTPRKRQASVALLVVAAAFALLVALGLWQVQRLGEKERLLATLDEKLSAMPVAFDPAADEWTVVGFEGEFLPQRVIHIGPRTMNGQAGLHVFVPLALKDGGVVFVNTGWVPATAGVPDVDFDAPSGPASLAGVLRRPAKGYFTPANDSAKNQWYWPDLAAMAASLPEKQDVITTVYIQQTQQSAGAYPVPVPPAVDIPNNHRGYALFWFTMAGLVVVFYRLAARRGSGGQA